MSEKLEIMNDLKTFTHPVRNQKTKFWTVSIWKNMSVMRKNRMVIYFTKRVVCSNLSIECCIMLIELRIIIRL